MNERITRQQALAASMDLFLRAQLFTTLGYPTEQVEILESFPHNLFDGPLSHAYVAYGFDVDDGGRSGEMGSDLVVRVHDVEIYVFAHTAAYGRNLAPTIRDIFDVGTIPLHDIRQSEAPEIDKLIVENAAADRLPLQDPKPWEEHVWLVTVKVRDEYYANSW